ncbi:TetR/AcrR family transcriptional regulator [Pseudocnuella soli]|uniref:TetR/AcrR family transcriptional regulator n=1 Tax=Pseudocnuella soli TaxID=2502779 RepID=UPI00104530A5|nr:TetR/AcrR family transcriptional regulator [Pseudocnuella soli]
MTTKEKIRDKALEMFNERGIEYVGLRELAALLQMRVGNITYYFPTKDDLVFELARELAKKNNTTIVAPEDLTMLRFLEMMHQVFLNHVTFRCLLLSFVHVMEQNKIVRASYQKTQGVRTATIKTNLETLSAAGYLQLNGSGDLEYLVSALSLINRFWISEAAVSFREKSTEEQMGHYLNMIGKLLEPYASATGKRHIKQFIEGLS